MRRVRPIVGLLTLFTLMSTPTQAADKFYLKDGDRVVFYGDSITDQRLYTTFVETFVVTRYPNWDVTFVHSGWGGDRVTGGGGGPIDKRLNRDVFSYGPSVVTVMLGMNDASYRPFDRPIFETYSKGYEHLVQSVKTHLPGVRMTLIQPSPFDDVTRKPAFEGGYNKVLVRYGEFVKELAKKENVDVADLNTSVVEATERAFASNPDQAPKLNEDRVHPGPAGQLLMASALLKAWNAPALVSEVSIERSDNDHKASWKNSKVSDLVESDGTLSWTQLDDALPFPIDMGDSIVRLAVHSSDVVDDLDRQTLKVQGLKDGEYDLKIDGQSVGTFSSDKLSTGINLATLATPMVAQAKHVHRLTLKHNDIHFARWRQFQVPFENEPSYQLMKVEEDLDGLEAELIKEQHEAAKPKPRKFELAHKS